MDPQLRVDQLLAAAEEEVRREMKDTCKSPQEGMYAEWKWDSLRKCWVYYKPYCIYPGEGGFTVSSSECWHEGIFPTFEEAEIEALGISKEQAENDRKQVQELRERGLID